MNAVRVGQLVTPSLALARYQRQHRAPLSLRAPVPVAPEVAVLRGRAGVRVVVKAVRGVEPLRRLVPVAHLAVEVGVVPQQRNSSWHLARLPILKGAHPREGARGQLPVSALQAAGVVRPLTSLHRGRPAHVHPHVDVPVLGEGGGAHQGGPAVTVGADHVLGRAERPLARDLGQRPRGPPLVEAVGGRGLDEQLGLLLVVVVDVLPEVVVLLDHAGRGVAEDGAHHGGEAAYLDPRQHPDGAAYAHSHQGADHRQPGHGDGRVIMIAIFILKLRQHESSGIVILCIICYKSYLSVLMSVHFLR